MKEWRELNRNIGIRKKTEINGAILDCGNIRGIQITLGKFVVGGEFG